jgi:hypothetical protein
MKRPYKLVLHYPRLKMLASDKHCSLLDPLVSYEENEETTLFVLHLELLLPVHTQKRLICDTWNIIYVVRVLPYYGYTQCYHDDHVLSIIMLSAIVRNVMSPSIFYNMYLCYAETFTKMLH